MKKTDQQIGKELKNYILDTFKVNNLSHTKFYKIKNKKADENNYVQIYIDRGYVSLDVCINKRSQGITLYNDDSVNTPYLKQGNFKDIDFPDMKKIFNFVTLLLKAKKEEVEQRLTQEKKEQIKALKRELAELQSNKNKTI